MQSHDSSVATDLLLGLADLIKSPGDWISCAPRLCLAISQALKLQQVEFFLGSPGPVGEPTRQGKVDALRGIYANSVLPVADRVLDTELNLPQSVASFSAVRLLVRRNMRPLRAEGATTYPCVVLVNASDSPDVFALFALTSANPFIETATSNTWYQIVSTAFIALNARITALARPPALEAAVDTSANARATFAQQVLNWSGNTVPEFSQFLCEGWLEISGATWCWLWVFNAATEAWEIGGAYPPTGRYAPSKLVQVDDACVAAYVTAIKKPVFVPDIATWFGDLNGRRHEVKYREPLEKLGCKSVLTVPVLSPQLQSTTRVSEFLKSSDIKAVVCAYYTDQDPSAIPRHPESALMMFGQFTAFSLQFCCAKKHQDLLIALNRLADKYSSQTGPPSLTRAVYVTDLIALIKREVDCECCSVFFHDLLDEHLECLGTTGLYHADGRKLTRHEMATLRYVKDESETSKVWQNGRPRVFRVNEVLNPPVVIRSTELKPDDLHKGALRRGAVCYPISGYDKPSVTPTSHCVGVIRCGASIRHIGQINQAANFDVFQLNALDFIGSQIAPVLESLNRAMRREDAVSQTKHDLKTPTTEIIHRTRRLLKWLENGRASFIALQHPPELGHEAEALCASAIAKMLAKSAPLLVPDRWLRENSDLESAPDRPTLLPEAAWKAVQYELGNIHLDGVLSDKLVDMLDSEKSFLELFSPEQIQLEGAIVARLRAGFALSAQRKNLRMKFDGRIRDVFPPLNIDPVFIERVFRNLLDNALKYANRNSDVIIRPRKDDIGFYIDIEDQGLGVAPEDRERVFTGYRSESARATGEPGKGLGLKMSQQMMRRHGGHIAVTHLMNPTTFTVFFPKHLAVTATKT